MFHSNIQWPSSTKIQIAYHTHLGSMRYDPFLWPHLLHLSSIISQLSHRAYSAPQAHWACSHLRAILSALLLTLCMACSLISDKFEFKCHFYRKASLAKLSEESAWLSKPPSHSISHLHVIFLPFIHLVLWKLLDI